MLFSEQNILFPNYYDLKIKMQAIKIFLYEEIKAFKKHIFHSIQLSIK